jgi:enhancing lycopene biosynthesis protein 2
MAKVAVVLAGCGVYDGAEINEAVLALLALEQQGAEYHCFAPDIEQMHVVNHLTGEVMEGERRNVLVEAARIVRGNIRDLAQARVDEFDALLVPGGFGAAKNLSDFAVKGASMTVQPDFLRFAQAMHQAGKPIGLICIAPTMAAAICGAGVECTIGNDAEVAGAIAAMGGRHITCPVEQAVVDRDRKLVTTPAYMLAGRVSEAATGISACVREVLALA